MRRLVSLYPCTRFHFLAHTIKFFFVSNKTHFFSFHCILLYCECVWLQGCWAIRQIKAMEFSISNRKLSDNRIHFHFVYTNRNDDGEGWKRNCENSIKAKDFLLHRAREFSIFHFATFIRFCRCLLGSFGSDVFVEACNVEERMTIQRVGALINRLVWERKKKFSHDSCVVYVPISFTVDLLAIG